MPLSFSGGSDTPLAYHDGAASTSLTASQVALAGIAFANTSSAGGGRPTLVHATLNIHASTGALVTVQILESVSNTVLAQAQVTFNNGGSDEYKTVDLQAGITMHAGTSYGFEVTASISGGTGTAISGGISVVGSYPGLL